MDAAERLFLGVDNLIIDHLSGLLDAGARTQVWAIDDPRFTAVVLFSGMHDIVADAYLKEKRIVRNRPVERLQHVCFMTLGLLSYDG